MKPKLGGFFWTKAAEFWLAYQFGRSAGRPDEVGAPRESIVRKFLQAILPPTIGVTKGHIIYKEIENGIAKINISYEFDIILYDASVSPVFPWDADERIKAIPFEHVLGVVEVKSTLTDKEAQNVSKKKVELDKIIHAAFEAADLNPNPSSLPSLRDYQVAVPEHTESEDIDDYEVGDNLYGELPASACHPSPFFFVFSFSEDIQEENGASGYFCNHAGMASGKPDGIFIFDKGYCLRKKDNMIARAVALMHGADLKQAEDSIIVADDDIGDMIYCHDSYRRDYWDSGNIPQDECLASFLNFVVSLCEVSSNSGHRMSLDIGQLLGLWLKGSPIHRFNLRPDDIGARQ